VEKSIWEKGAGKNASMKGLGSHNRIEERVYSKEGKDIFIVKGRKGESASIYGRPTTKRVYSILQITANVTRTLCGKKGW